MVDVKIRENSSFKQPLQMGENKAIYMKLWNYRGGRETKKLNYITILEAITEK